MTEQVPKPSWHFKYFLTRADVSAFASVPHPLVGKDKIMLILPLVSAGIIYALFRDSLRALLPYGDRVMAANLTVMAVLMLIAYFTIVLLLSVTASVRLARAPAVSSEIETLVYLDHVRVIEDGQTRILTWDVMHVADDPTHVFLITGPHQAIILPRRAFTADDELRTFARWADDRVREAAAALAPDHDHDHFGVPN